VLPLNPAIIGAPTHNSFLDLSRCESVVETATHQRRQLAVGGETQPKELPVSEFSNAGAERLIKNAGESQPLFQTNDAVLNTQRILTDAKNGNDRCHRHHDKPACGKTGKAKKLDHGVNSTDKRNRKDEEVKRRIDPGVVGKCLRLIGHVVPAFAKDFPSIDVALR